MSDLSATKIYYETRELCHKDVYKHIAQLRKSLIELKSVSKKALEENTMFWEKKVERIKEEKDEEWLAKVNLTEEENKQLRSVIQRLTKENSSKLTNDEHLSEMENEIGKLNRQLDEKLIHINKLQIALAEQSKAVFELEKTCALLCYEFRKAHLRDMNKLKKKLEKESQNQNGIIHSTN